MPSDSESSSLGEVLSLLEIIRLQQLYALLLLSDFQFVNADFNIVTNSVKLMT